MILCNCKFPSHFNFFFISSMLNNFDFLFKIIYLSIYMKKTNGRMCNNNFILDYK